MRKLLVVYSLTGNNEKLAKALEERKYADVLFVREHKKRKFISILFDRVFNRTPNMPIPSAKLKDYDLLIFMGPVWMERVSSPLRGYFNWLQGTNVAYAFVSVCGGASGHNKTLQGELEKRTGKKPAFIKEFLLADLMAWDKKPTKLESAAYRVTSEDVNHFAEVLSMDKSL